jgi:transcriptional regulator with XRE-family HTH domain
LGVSPYGGMEFGPGWTNRWIRGHGERLRELRRERQISRKHLADEARVNVSQINRVEAGRDARLSTFLKIYEGLGYGVEFELREEGLLMGKRWR